MLSGVLFNSSSVLHLLRAELHHRISTFPFDLLCGAPRSPVPGNEHNGSPKLQGRGNIPYPQHRHGQARDGHKPPEGQPSPTREGKHRKHTAVSPKLQLHSPSSSRAYFLGEDGTPSM